MRKPQSSADVEGCGFNIKVSLVIMYLLLYNKFVAQKGNKS